jgi:hypothetical protein
MLEGPRAKPDITDFDSEVAIQLATKGLFRFLSRRGRGVLDNERQTAKRRNVNYFKFVDLTEWED